MANILSDFLIRIGVNTEAGKIDSMKHSLGSLTRTTLVVAGGIATFGTAVFGMANKVGNATDEFGKTADQIGVSTEFLEQFARASEYAGGSADQTVSSFVGMKDQLNELIATGKRSEALSFLGITPEDAKDTEGAINKIIKELRKIPETQKGATGTALRDTLAKQLGLDKGTLRLIQMTNDEYDGTLKRAKKYELQTKRQSQISAEFNDTQTDLIDSFKSFERIVFEGLAPSLIEMQKELEKTFANPEFRQNAIQTSKDILESFSALGQGIKELIGFARSMSKAFSSMGIGLKEFAEIIVAFKVIGLLKDMLFVFQALGKTPIGRIAGLLATVGTIALESDSVKEFISGDKKATDTAGGGGNFGGVTSAIQDSKAPMVINNNNQTVTKTMNNTIKGGDKNEIAKHIDDHFGKVAEDLKADDGGHF